MLTKDLLWRLVSVIAPRILHVRIGVFVCICIREGFLVCVCVVFPCCPLFLLLLLPSLLLLLLLHPAVVGLQLAGYVGVDVISEVAIHRLEDGFQGTDPVS